jgi:hypothetical protein
MLEIEEETFANCKHVRAYYLSILQRFRKLIIGEENG